MARLPQTRTYKSVAVVKTKTVSVIIPFFNASATKLQRSLQSVLDQSHQPTDIIVVDDGSVLPFADLQKSDEFFQRNITWHALGTNSGVAAARNRGADLANGDTLAFLDTGDWWEPTKLEEQLIELENHPEAGLVYTSASVHRANGVKLLAAKAAEDAYMKLLVTQPITGSASSVLMPKHVFQAVGGFFEGYDIPEDRDLWLRVAEHYKVLPVENVLVHLQEDPHSRSMDPLKKEKTYKTFLDMHEEKICKAKKWRQARADMHIGLAIKFLRGRMLTKCCRHSFLGVFFSPSMFAAVIVRRILLRHD